MDYHLAMGVDHIIVTDNLSVDMTPDIIESFVGRGLATYIHEPSDDFDQASWVTRMAKMANADLGADWVVHGDADEFWMTEDGQPLDVFFRSARWHNVVVAPRHDFVCRAGSEERPFYERMTVAKTRSLNPLGKPLPPKVAHRSKQGVEVAYGNHFVSGFRWQRRRSSGLQILHFPLRSRSQYIKKIENGGRAFERNTSAAEGVGRTWRVQYEELRKTGTLPYLDENIWSDELVARGLEDGSLKQDTRLRDFLRRLEAH